MPNIQYDVDDADHAAIQAAITRWQRYPGATSDGTGDKGGRILAEICRGWLELHGREPSREAWT